MTKKAYHGGAFYGAIGEDFSHLERHNNVISADTLDAWYPPSPKVLEKVATFLPFVFQSSPPTHSAGLVSKISEKRNIPVENIAVGAGSSDLMFRFFPLALDSKKTVMILDPMYGEYRHIFEHVIGCKIMRHALDQGRSFDIDANLFIRDVHTHKPDMIVIVNPNSPTGRHWKRDDIRKVLSSISRETMLIIDETYIEYVGEDASMEKDVLTHPNLVILKSMSKIYALSGARVGYLVASKEIVDRVLTHTPPWNVSHFAQIAAVEALDDWEYYKRKIKETCVLRDELAKEIRILPSVDIIDGVANYFLLKLRSRKASDVVSEMRKSDVFLRNCDSMSDEFNDDSIRIAVRDRESNQKIAECLRKILS